MLYLVALERRHRMFSISQCLSVMMWWHTPAGMGSTTMVVSDCKLLMQSTGIASAVVACTDVMK